MINDESRRKLREMNLGEIISGLEAQQTEPATLGLPFDDRMQRLVDYVYQEKYNAKIQRLIRSARLRFPQADMQGILYEGRGLNRELLGNLSSCQYIDAHQSIVLQGFTGSGKTYLACALGKQACLNQFRVLYIRLPDLLMEYGDCAAIIGSPKKLLNPILRPTKCWGLAVGPCMCTISIYTKNWPISKRRSAGPARLE